MDKMKKKFLKALRSPSTVQIIFLLIACSFITLSWHMDLFGYNTDLIFHYHRAIEIINDLKHFQLPQFNLHSTFPYGVATETMYPWLSIIFIVAPLMLGFSYVHSLLIAIMLIMYIGLNIAFYSCRSFTNSNKMSLLFAIFYCYSLIILYATYQTLEMGFYVGMMLIPLIFFGWISWIQHGRYKMMTIGLILLSFTHLMGLLLTILVLIVLTLLLLKKLNKFKLIQLCKAIILVILCTTIIWLPIAVLSKANVLAMPQSRVMTPGKLFPKHLLGWFLPQLIQTWTYSDAVAVILGLIYWKKLPSLLKKFYIISLVVFWLEWKPFPFMMHPPFTIIQMYARFVFVEHFMMTYILVYIIINICCKKWYIRNVVILIAILLGVTFIAISVGILEQSVYAGKHYPTLYERAYKIGNYDKTLLKQDRSNYCNFYKLTPTSKHKHKGYEATTRFDLNNTSLSSKLLKTTGMYYDYAPYQMKHHFISQLSDKGIKHPITLDHNKYISIKSYYDHYVTLPIAIYHAQNYRVDLNGCTVPYKVHNGCLRIRVYKGNNKIKLQAPIMWYRWLAVIITLTGIMLFGYLDHKKSR